MTRILEGTWEEIKSHDAELAGLRLRVIVEPEEVDYAAHIPPPPNTVRDKAHLEELLLEGLNSGPATPMTAADWDDIRRQVRDRLAKKSA